MSTQIGRRIQVVQDGDDVHIVIGPAHWLERLIAFIFFGAFFSILACALVATLLPEVGLTEAPLAFLLLFESVIVAMLVLVAHSALWTLFGQEEFILKEGELKIARALLGRRWVRSFVVGRIMNLRYEERATRRSAIKAICFEYDDKKVWSGSQLQEMRGKALIRGPLSGLTRRRPRNYREGNAINRQLRLG